LKRRNGLSRREALRRINNQMALARKVRRADAVLDGTDDKAAVRKEVRRLLTLLQRSSGHL
jgi:dephospho-CoA kinase